MNDSYDEIKYSVAPEDFPDIDSEMLTRKVNELFRPYLFFHKERTGREFWCSACGEHWHTGYNEPVTTNQHMYAMWGEHNDEAVCPACGKSVTMKNTAKLGKRKNLLEHHPVIFLTEKDDAIYARAYWSRKDYQRDYTEPPKFMLSSGYCFTRGHATHCYDYYGKWETNSIEGNYDPNHRVITEPFVQGSYNYQYVSYKVYGWEALEESRFFKYCQYDMFSHRAHESDHYDLMKYLAAYCIYPEQIEMLLKCGKRRYVDELVSGRRKNARAIKWGEKDPKKAFKLNGQELRAYMRMGDDPELLVQYKRLRRAKLYTGFEELSQIIEETGFGSDELFEICCNYKIKPGRAMSYLNRFTGPRCHGRYFGYLQAIQMWKDYIDMAEKLGWNLEDRTVLMPKDLDARHDAAAKERQLQLDAQKQADEEERWKAAEKSLEIRRKKYNFSLEGFSIRIAETEREILAEGNALQHCVGGYAQRHMANQTTILFLRPDTAPNTPFVTIEMNGNTLVQAHGYRNECTKDGFNKAPRELFSFIFDPWLNWVKAGSQRDKDGQPKIRRRKNTA